jgi:hypothetical protein
VEVEASGAIPLLKGNFSISAFMINTNVTAKVVTAILLNFDTFDGGSTARGALLAASTDAQKEAGTKIGQKLFLLNRRALCARYGGGDHLRVPGFVFEKWAVPALPVLRGKVPNSPLYVPRTAPPSSSQRTLCWRDVDSNSGSR